MKLIPWEPLRELDDLFQRYSAFAGRSLPGSERRDWIPTADVSETDKEYLIKVELPEVKREDVKVTVEAGLITISGERKQQNETRSSNEIRIESMYGSFSRRFSLPDNVDAAHAQAESKDGVLRIRIPKTESQKSKPIAIDIK